MCDLLCLRYFQNHLLHSMMLLDKTIKTKKFVTVRTERFYSLCFLNDTLLLIVVPYFSRNNQHNVFGYHEQFLLFLQVCDQQVCVSFDLLIFVLGPASASRMACQAVKVGQGFHEIAEWSLCLLRSFPCISNSYIPVPSQKLIQMLPFSTTLLTA